MKIIAVSTTFFPDENFLDKNFSVILKEIDKFIIVDNSENYCFNLLKNNDFLEIIYSKNFGVSGGLNIGIKRAIELDADFIILFDQDSISGKGLIGSLLKAPGLVKGMVVVAPNVFDKTTETEIHSKFFGHGKSLNARYTHVNRTQTSGLLVPVGVFKNVGFFNENYFLDFVDTEWCRRVSKAGYRILIDKESTLYHEFGEGEKKILYYNYKYGKPFREYYGARDTLYLLSETSSSIKFKFKLFFRFFWSLFNICFLDQKILRFSFFWRGVKHYLNGVRGKGL
ncbi:MULTISPECIES: hypothetical protein [unclassified Polaromonas]|uniref:hypothetical protein n=1 Tax=unclassified Polaromonas TaxID=2638319 RepID=UPI0018CBE842|nr:MULTISPECIES: hypothetical protein [unclassified Polaromonas]MBG6070812.1 rhamnosyltransferase [Polaromonas sp. CG_9.7]MBG6112878.1 rhamnosyltransferase [Polaromonas sp. CG_9.2]